MAFLAKARKDDLKLLAEELGEIVTSEHKIVDLKKLILGSKEYEEDFVKQMLETVIDERLEGAKREEEERIRIFEKEKEIEIEKLRLESNNGINENQLEVNVRNGDRNHADLQKLMQKFDAKEGDISFYLVLFERQARRARVNEEDWVAHLLGLLPYEINQLIAREPEEVANNYCHIKSLLLKRFKLSPEKFRQKFVQHQKTNINSWHDFVFELQNYFEEWIKGLNVTDFQGLKELMITDQLKRKVSFEMKEHFIDEWSKFVSPVKLADKLDEYESVRGNRKSANVVDNQASKRKIQTSPTTNNSKSAYSKPIRNDKGEPKCFNCNDYGHISRDCPSPKPIIKCRKCGENGHFQRNCTKEQITTPNSNYAISSFDAVEPTTYLKFATINDKENINALIDTGSSSCLLRESVARRLDLDITPEVKELYGFGNQNVPAAKTVGRTVANIEIDNVLGEDVAILIVKDDTQPTDLLIGRTWTDLPYIAYARVGNKLLIDYADNEPFNSLRPQLIDARMKLKAAHSVKIEPNTVNFIKAKTDAITNGLIMIQSPEDELGCLFKVVQSETVIPITNVGTVDVVLKENQCVGRAEEIELCFDEGTDTMESIPNETNEDCGDQILTVNRVEDKNPITLDEVKVDANVALDERRELLRLLNQYRDCFALKIEELGLTDLTKMEIKEIEDSRPVSIRAYKTNAAERAAIGKIVKEWRSNGIVTDTRSPYSSPVLLVKKKTGEMRLVVDYRRLNAQTVKDKFPLPRIDDLLENLNDCQVFTTLDLAHGYLQIPLSEESKLKTAFITPDETGQFERMIFGLANAPAEFQRLMSLVLGPMLNKKVLCYLDDILIPAKTWKEMVEVLIEVLEALRAAKLTLKLSKCEFGKREVEYLGFVITPIGFRPGPRKVQAITEFSEPRNIHEIRRFLGLTSFFRRFVPKYAEKAEPLSRLTKKDEKFLWTSDQQKSFDLLKKNLTNEPVLALYRPNARTEVHTDASSIGLAGMMLQLGDDDKWHLVYCVSKKTTAAEQNYHSSKLELMAIVWTLDRLRQFLIGIEFTLVTDCQALVYLNAKKSLNPQIARWSNLIQEYNFSVQHRPGQKMAHIDALSRSPVSDPKDTLDSIIESKLEVCLTLTVEEQVLMIQHADSKLREFIDILKKNLDERTTNEKRMVENYVLKENRLFRVVTENEKERLLYVMPKSMRKSLVVKFHDLMGHFAVDRTVNKIKELYWFPSMRRYVRQHISMCMECLMNKVPGGKQQGVLHPIKPGRRPFAIIHMDHLGPFVRSSKRNLELLVVIDNLTRFVRLFPMKSTSAKDVIKATKEFVNDFGLPERIITDRGTCFTSQQFEEYCNENGIFHTLNSTKHPRANGMVERVNRTVLPVMTTCMTDERHKDWDLRIKEVERNLNNVVNKTSDKTPFEMLHGYLPRFNDGILRKLADEDTDTWEDPKKIQEDARKRIHDQQEKTKLSFDKKKCRSSIFEPGEVVVVRRPPKSTGEPTKTQLKYRGPLVITDVLPNDTYRISQLKGRRNGRFYVTTAHVSQLKAYRGDDESSDDDISDRD